MLRDLLPEFRRWNACEEQVDRRFRRLNDKADQLDRIHSSDASEAGAGEQHRNPVQALLAEMLERRLIASRKAGE